jgi:hypothetical protein
MKKILLLVIIIYGAIFGQTYEYKKSIGQFTDAASLSINAVGFVYVSDKATNMVYKLDTLGTVLTSIGGYGWQNGSFDGPVDIFSNALNVFVTDKNNHRIQQFDKDLNYISQLYKRDSKNPDARFGYPLGCVVSNLGDLYVLDQENKRVVKYDLAGNFYLKFGGFEDSKYTITDPRKIGVAKDNRVYVLNGNAIYAYDNFGNGVKKMEMGFEISNFNTFGDNILLFYGKDLILGDLITGVTKNLLIHFPERYDFSKIVSFTMFNSVLYILTTNEIQIYSTAE